MSECVSRVGHEPPQPSTIVAEIDKCRLASALKVNQELLQLYWFVGKQILEKQEETGWGGGVIDQLSKDLSARYLDMKGFSVRNLKYMRAFAEAYPDFPNVQVPLAQITWYHHISLITKVKDTRERAFYIQQTAQNGWSRDVMLMQVDSRKTKEYDSRWNYGLYQIINELDTSYIDANGDTQYNYTQLHTYITTLKTKVKEYYLKEIVPYLFKYEFLK